MNMNYAELNEQKRQKINEDRERERHLFCIIKFGLFQPLCVNNSENIFVPIAEPNKKEFNGTYFIISFVLLFSFTLIAMLYSYVLAMWTK